MSRKDCIMSISQYKVMSATRSWLHQEVSPKQIKSGYTIESRILGYKIPEFQNAIF